MLVCNLYPYTKHLFGCVPPPQINHTMDDSFVQWDIFFGAKKNMEKIALLCNGEDTRDRLDGSMIVLSFFSVLFFCLLV